MNLASYRTALPCDNTGFTVFSETASKPLVSPTVYGKYNTQHNSIGCVIIFNLNEDVTTRLFCGRSFPSIVHMLPQPYTFSASEGFFTTNKYILKIIIYIFINNSSSIKIIWNFTIFLFPFFINFTISYPICSKLRIIISYITFIKIFYFFLFILC